MTDASPAFPALPRPDAADGSPRRIGVEIELGGLDESQVGEIARRPLAAGSNMAMTPPGS